MESPPPGKVVTRTDAASTTDCPFGGVIVASGLDDNGQLDDAEIQRPAPVCNEAPVQPPPAILVRLVPEPSTGGHCAEGGTAVQSGPDRNGNGRLDDPSSTRVAATWQQESRGVRAFEDRKRISYSRREPGLTRMRRP